MLSALSHSPDQQKIYFLLTEMMKGKDIRIQDQRNVILGTTSTYLGVVITWKFVRTHWDTLVEQNQLTSFTMRRVISACTVFQDSDDKAVALKFYQDKGISEMKSIQNALEVAETRLQWHEEFHSDIKLYLENWRNKKLKEL